MRRIHRQKDIHFTRRSLSGILTRWRRKMPKRMQALVGSKKALAGLAVIVFALVAQNLGSFLWRDHYELSPEALSLIGEVRDDASQYLKLSEDLNTYEFVVPEQNGDTTSVHTGRVADAYSARLSVNPKDGISVTDKNTSISMSVIPKFVAAEGRVAVGNQIVYPFGKNQLVYSLKYNGLKEDIIIPKFIDKELKYEFELLLPLGAEARLDKDGNIGIYTGDSSLFGNVSYGSDKDRELVEKARRSSEKNNLIASIPAPVIKDGAGKEYGDRSKFQLTFSEEKKKEVKSDAPAEFQEKLQQDSTFSVYNLTVASERLDELVYPIAIDPTFQISNAADFANMNLSPSAEIDSTDNVIQRASLGGGALNGWGSATSLPSAKSGHATTVYNGYLYVFGSTSGDRDESLYAKLNTNGTIASDSGCGLAWCTTTNIHSELWYTDVAAYNGYMYIVGGRSSSGFPVTTVEYAPINADGSLGTWTATASLPSTRQRHPIAVYNGYLYVFGGQTTGGGNVADVDYARLNADGSIAADSGCAASWCGGTDLPRNSSQSYVGIYNGVIYFAAGLDGGSQTNEVLISRIDSSTGMPGSWTATASLNVGRNDFSAGEVIFHGGYAYIAGGCVDAACDTKADTVEYAPINANGTLGAWDYTDSLTTARSHTTQAVWNGYIYEIGGCTAGSCSSSLDTVEYTSIRSAGSLDDGAWSATTTFTTSRRWHNAHVYNGFLYVIGGRNTSAVMQNTIQYAAINTDGTVGSWTVSGNTFTAGLRNLASEIYGGYVYISGGMTTDTGSSDVNRVEYAQIAADGSVGTWATTTTLSADNAWHDMFAWNGYLYTVGGAGFTNIEYAAINSSNGTVGSWSSAGALPNEMTDATVLLHGGYIYLVGGCSGSSCPGFGGNQALYQTTVDYAPVNSNGTIGSWTATSSFTNGRSAKQALIYNGYLYLLGGYDFTNDTAYDDVQLAPINSNGSLGSFTYTESLPDTYFSFGAVAWNGYMYVVGGQSGAGTTNEVSYKRINNGGSGGPNTFTAGPLFTSSRKNHASVAYDGYLYVLGGCTTATTCTTATNNVRYAPINSDGSIGTWADVTTSFTTARRDLHAWALNGRMYVAGGRDAGGTFLTDIQYVTIQSSGDISTSWTTDGTAFPSNGYAPGVALNDNVLYVLGGSNSGGDDTWYAVIDTSTGDVGTFTATTLLPEGRQRAWAVVYKGYIYAIGGYDGSAYLYSVWYAPLNSDNTIGTWRMASTQLNEAIGSLSGTSAFAINGYIYIAGGGSATPRRYIDYAPVGTNGDLGVWQRGITTGLTDHYDFAAVEYNGVMYTTGGRHSVANPSSSSRYAPIQSIPRIGNFSKTYDFESGVRPTKLVTRGLKQTDSKLAFNYSTNESCNNSTYTNLQTSTDIGLGSTNAVDINIGDSTLARCLNVSYTLADTDSSVFPDTGNESYISDFDVYYIPNPNSRLRGGRSFVNGADGGLQANPEELGGKLLTSNLNDSNLSSYVTASVAPDADKVLLLGIMYAISGSSTPSAPTSISGLGLTWTEIGSVVGTGNGTTARTIKVYRAQTGTSPPTPGTITISFSGARDVAGWAVMEFSGVALGNNGADAVAGVDTDETDSTVLNLDFGDELANSYVVVFANNNTPTNLFTGTGSELATHTSLNTPTTLWTIRYSSTGETVWTMPDGGTTRKATVGVRMTQ